MGRYFYMHRPYLFPMPFCKNQTERQETMKIKMRYENVYQTIEVESAELEKWLNISVSEEESQEDYEKRIQKEIEERFNRPDYNNWHKHDRHIGVATMRNRDGEVEVNSEEAVMSKAVDSSIYTKDFDEIDARFDREYQYDYYSNFIRENLKPNAADMVIAIVLDGMTIDEYAEKINDTPNNVSHRYRRAINKLKNFFQKRPFDPSTKATR